MGGEQKVRFRMSNRKNKLPTFLWKNDLSRQYFPNFVLFYYNNLSTTLEELR